MLCAVCAAWWALNAIWGNSRKSNRGSMNFFVVQLERGRSAGSRDVLDSNRFISRGSGLEPCRGCVYMEIVRLGNELLPDARGKSKNAFFAIFLRTTRVICVFPGPHPLMNGPCREVSTTATRLRDLLRASECSNGFFRGLKFGTAGKRPNRRGRLAQTR